jgi:hypothetical protein
MYLSSFLIILDSYDVVTGSGLYANEAHVPCEALYEMIRLVKPGKVICKLNPEIVFL